MKSTRLVVSLLLGINLLAACGGEPRPDLQPMFFSIDPGRLGTPVEAADLGIVFQPPAEWMPLSAAELDSVGRVVAGNPLGVEPRYMFTDLAYDALLLVAVAGQAEARTLAEQVTRYKDMLAAEAGGATVQQDEFLKDGLHIAQFLVRTSDFVTFTLFFAPSRDGVLQFDYIVPNASYAEQVKAIESSIGSIQRIQ